MKAQNEAVHMLQRASLKATSGRVAIVMALTNAASPLTAIELHSQVRKVDLVTVYRTLAHLQAKGIARSMRFNDGVERFELQDSHHRHHHHVVCTECGHIDELPECDIKILENTALRMSSFAKITDHALEFFGSCKSCGAV